MAVPIYITSVHPILDENKSSIIWDVIYVDETNSEKKCLRILNPNLSFLVARLPGMTEDQFKDYISRHCSKVDNVNVQYRNDLVEATYFQFGEKRTYAEIMGKNPQTLNKIHIDLYKEASDWYEILEQGKKGIRFTPEDFLFIKNTETPFRYTNFSTNLARSIYVLSTKHKVPLIGGAQLDISKCVDYYPDILVPKLDNIKSFDVDKHNIEDVIIPDPSVDLRKNMTMVSYDIETYNKDGDLSPIPPSNYIFSIGVGVFNLNSSVPYKRYCMITKQINERELENAEVVFVNKHKHIIVKHEYSEENENDETTYIICSDERDILITYIKLIRSINPHIICGFNSFGFDDNYMYVRSEKHGLNNMLLQLYTPYDLEEFTQRKYSSWNTPLIPKHDSIQLKFDGIIHKNEFKTIRSSYLVMVDVHKLMVKEDPKRFTQHGRGKLDDMLLVYKTVNPFTGQQLSKTGLSIPEMYRRWDSDENIYSIAMYCCQDAWICGTLIMGRGKLTDSIQMAVISRTALSDSIYRADGIRVATTRASYSHAGGFALMDEPSKTRSDDKTDLCDLGFVEFDKRTVIGGAVRNIHPGKHQFVMALDFSSMYPSQTEASNVDSSTIVDPKVIENPERFGLSIVNKKTISDMYGTRHIYYIKKL